MFVACFRPGWGVGGPGQHLGGGSVPWAKLVAVLAVQSTRMRQNYVTTSGQGPGVNSE